MENQKYDTVWERGGIPVRDYTLAGRFEMDGTRGGLEKMNFDRLARFLGMFSLGLGLVELLLPRRLQQLVGVRGNHTGLIRLLGLRELTHALLIFMQPRPIQGMWSRVVGDALDLACLGAALQSRRSDKERVALAAVSVLGVTALDAATAVQVGRKQAEGRQYSVITREDLDSRTRGGAFHVSKSITINRSPEELYRFWRDFVNLPQFMYHLEAVQVLDERRSRWTAKAPAGTRVEWEAEITDDRPNELIAWQSTKDAEVPNTGLVVFDPAPAGRGTVVRVEIEYRPPGGAIGKAIAKLFGEEPGQQVAGDLKRFKQVVETGEVVRSEGSPQGFGQKLQHPAQPKPGNRADGQEKQAPRSGSKKKREQETAR